MEPIPPVSLAGWYDNPIHSRFLAPIDCLNSSTDVHLYSLVVGNTGTGLNIFTRGSLVAVPGKHLQL
jgi:hypothetical protein